MDDEGVDADIDEPWGGTWDSTSALNRGHVLRVQAEDPSGNTGSATVSVAVSNDGGLDSGAVVISGPSEDGTVCGDVTVTTSVSDEVVSVLFSLDGVEVELDEEAPFTWDWDTTGSADGPHTVSAQATDSEGQDAWTRLLWMGPPP